MKFGVRELMFLGIMLAMLAGAYVFVFHTGDVRRAERVRQTDDKLKSLDELQRATAGVRDIDHKLTELQQATAFFESKLPQAKEIDKVLKEVWQLAEANSLQTRTVKTLKSQKMNGYSEQPIEMSLSGDFIGFYKFLLELEGLPRLTRVTQMKLDKIQDRDGEMQAQLTLSIFFEPETDGAPSTASAQ